MKNPPSEDVAPDLPFGYHNMSTTWSIGRGAGLLSKWGKVLVVRVLFLKSVNT